MLKKQVKKVAAYLMSACILTSAFTVMPGTPFSMEAEAHSGRTDANGGHKDNKNKSGLGSYHYHCGGHPAHLHPNGVCPYQSGISGANKSADNSETRKTAVKENVKETVQETQPATEAVTTGWKQDSNGWRYCTGDNAYYNNGWQMIDNKWYYFESNGYMKTGWLELDDEWYYLEGDGHMVTGETDIGGTLYYFESDGKLNDDYAGHGNHH